MSKTKVTIGLFGTGLEAYWDQFEGLLPRLNGYLDQIREKSLMKALK